MKIHNDDAGAIFPVRVKVITGRIIVVREGGLEMVTDNYQPAQQHC